MRLELPFLLLGLCITAYGDQVKNEDHPSEVLSVKNLAPKPRIVPLPPSLGFSLQKPDPMVAAQLPDLPPGIGFIVTSVDEVGPAAAAGIKIHDVIWKLGDQLLVNEAQMVALLGIHKPGDQIVLSGFRSGKACQFRAVLGKPEFKQRLTGILPSIGTLPADVDRGVTRVVNFSEKFAKTRGIDGEAEIRKEGDSFRLFIRNSNQVEVFNSLFAADTSFEGVPEEWRARAIALKRALDRSIKGTLPFRQPRPRVMPPATAPQRSVTP
jgi:hypothetical protein